MNKKYILIVCLLLFSFVSNGQLSTDFSASRLIGYVPLKDTFTDLSSGSPIKWHWVFGTGKPKDTSNVKNPIFTYTVSGIYSVTLIDSDALGNGSTITKTAYIVAKPQAKFTATPLKGYAPLSVSFSNQSTGAANLKFFWKFDTNNPADTITKLTTSTFSHTYSVAGTYSVRLIVVDTINNLRDTLTKLLYDTVLSQSKFSPSPPNGCASVGHAFTTRFFDQTTGGHIFQWHYSFDTSNHTDTVFGSPVGIYTTNISPFHIYTVAGTYVARLAILDSFGYRDTSFKTITVAPSLNVNFYTPDTLHYCPPHTVTFYNTSDTVAGCSKTFNWYMNDGSVLHSNYVSQTVSHTFTASGTYNISLEDVASCNCGTPSTTKNGYIKIDAFSTPCFTTTDTSGCGAPFPVTFHNCSIGAVSYLWNFGDGTTDTAANPVHTYLSTDTGGFNVSLTSYTSGGCPTTITKIHRIKVGNFNGNFHTNYNFSPYPPSSIICVNTPAGSVNTTLRLIDSTFQATWHKWRFSPAPNDTSVNTTAQFVTHSWSVSGVYAVTDSSWNPTLGCAVTSTKNIFVAPLPRIDSITANNPYRCGPNDTVQFISHITDTTTWSIIWHFGDPSTGIDDSAFSDSAHIYTSIGQYTPNVKVTDAYGCISRDTFSNFININAPFSAIHISKDSGCVPLNVTYIDTVSQNGVLLPFYLDSVAYSDGSVTDTGILITNSHIYSAEGRYMMYNYIRLDSSIGGCTYVDSYRVSAGTAPILADMIHAIPPLDSVCPQVGVRFFDNCFNCSSVTWNVSGMVFHTMDSTFALSSFGSKSVMYVPNNLGCTDTLRSDSLFVWPPNVNFTISVPNCGVRDSFKFTNTTVPLSGYTYHYVWNFGDGSALVTNSGTTPGTQPAVTHMYSVDGTYTVTLIDSSISPNYHSCANFIQQVVYVYPIIRSDSDFYVNKTITCKTPSYPTSLSLITFRGYLTQYGTLYKNYLWKYGDGGSNNILNTDTVYHQYASNGIYSPKLILTNLYNCKDSITKTNYVTIEAPYRGIGVNGSVTSPSVPVTGCAWFLAHFHDSVTAYPGRTLTKRKWGFNVGTTTVPAGTGVPPANVWATGSVPQTDTSIYFPVGLYHVVVSDTDDLGCFVTDTVHINSVKPVAAYTCPDSIACTYVKVMFHSTTPHVSYNWLFGDNTGVIASSTSDTFHIYTVNGLYRDTLIAISDGAGGIPANCRDTSSQVTTVTIGNSSVHAAFNFNGGLTTASCPPLLVNLRSTSTSTTTNYLKWGYGVDSSFTSPTTLTSSTFTYTYPGVYNVTLIDSNSIGCKDTTHNTVTISGPTGTMTITPDTICVNQTVHLHVATSTIPPVDTVYVWTVGSNSYGSDSGGTNVTAPLAGTYHPNVIIKQASSSCTVTIYATDSIRVNPTPIIVLPIDSICKNSSVTITATGANAYVWSPSYGLSTTTRANPVASPTITTTYKVIGTTNHGCKDSVNTTITVNPTPTAISGTLAVCNGATTNLSNGTSGGTWTSVNTAIATISSTGVVTGVSPGTVTISYTIGNCYSTSIVTVNVQPAAILGTTSICNLATSVLTDATAGGVWSSSNTNIATVLAGTITGRAVGSCFISYTKGSCTSVRLTTVNSQPNAISGTASLCNYSTTNLFNDTTGGAWTTGNSTIASVNSSGVVSGLLPGIVPISYTKGICYSVKNVTVNVQPDTISGGSTSICNGTNTTFVNDSLGGNWSSSLTGIATINSSGVVSAVSVGSTVISYSIGNCSAQTTLSVNVQPAAVTGSTNSICNLSNTTFADISPSGSWSSSNSTIATVNSSGIVTGVLPGNTIISYTIGNCTSTKTITINIQPAAISGNLAVCNTFTSLLTNDTLGGTWSSSSTPIATISSTTGLATSHAVGTTNITYTVGSCKSTAVLSVNIQPAATTGTASVCNYSSTSLSNATGSGTWSSVSTGVATVNSSGVVTGALPGNSIISYTIGNCASTKTVTVNSQPDAISGVMSICNLSTTALTNDTLGGIWTSGAPATASVVAATGVVTAHLVGTANITYTLGSCKSYATITVNTQPAAITGTGTVCNYSSTLLSDATGSGTWSSVSTGVATVNSSGVVTGVLPGTSLISYTIGSCVATKTVTVNIQPDAISGVMSICNSTTTLLTNDTIGGAWTSGAPTIASIVSGTGVVTGHLAGTANITYTLGGCKSYATVTINPQPTAITGTATLCNYSTTALADAVGSGTWSSVSTGVATVNNSGVVTGVTPGTSIISYIIGSCYATKTVTVNNQPAPVSGTLSICNLSTTLLTNDSTGGTWSSGTTTVATISVGGLVTGILVGTTNITYTIGGCKSVATVTVNTQPAAITGTSTPICNYSTTTFGNTTLGGTWSSSNTNVATVNSTGLVTGALPGTAIISYTVGNCYATKTVTINNQPAAITGISALCNFASATFINDSVGGNWTSSNSTVATINSSGVLTASSVGNTIVSYTLGNCYSTKNITVNIQPDAISGTRSVCNLGTTLLINDSTGGVWSSSITGVATVTGGGLVTGQNVGTSTITYKIGNCYSTAIVTINSQPSAINGLSSICNFASTTFTDDSLGGSWISTNTTVATLNNSGIVTGVIPGNTIISYTIGNCTSTKTITINIQPDAISGNLAVCNTFTSLLTSDTLGGTWSSSATPIATINSTTGLVTSLAVGTTNITYSVGSCKSIAVLSVNIQPAAITGTASVCNYSSTSLSDVTGSGTWSSVSTGVATVNSSGVVTGALPGNTIISYTIGNCASTKTVTVNSQPDAISGVMSICNLTTTALTNDTLGGTWTSGAPTIASIVGATGVVTAHLVGTANITYTLGSCKSYATVTVNTQPAAITGTATVCNYSSTSLADATGSGTWSSVSIGVATVNSSGVVTGVLPGTSLISYTIGSCVATKTVTVNIQPDAISGVMSICNSSTTVLTDDTIGGAWTSSAPTIASIVSGTGVVTGHLAGTANITYTLGSCKSYATVTINPQPTAITGTATLCNYSTTALADAVGSGTWSSVSTGVATVNSSGVVTGVTPGTSIISYIIGGCYATKVVTVNNQPDSISGTLTLCNLSTTLLTNDSTGGTWSSGSIAVALISSGGLVTGRSVGTSIITYAIGSCKSYATVTVNTQPAAITGTSTPICNYSTTTFANATPGGTWSSSNTNVATVDNTGLVTGVLPGTAIISYTIGNCNATKIVTVNSQPDAITGNLSFCKLSSSLLTNDTLGGIWSSSNAGVASVSSSGLVTGNNVGSATITYLLAGCRSTAIVTINTQPVAIGGGSASICNYASTTFTDATAGGTWSSVSSGVATINNSGVVTGVIPGTTVISYTIGNCTATKTVTVNIQPAPISGSLAICRLSSSALTNDTLGGVWSSVSSTVAYISSTGIVTANIVGTSVISYTVGNCVSTAIVTVNFQPAPVVGSVSSICNLSSTTFTETTIGGVWSSSSTGIATVNGSGLVTGIIPGVATISYTKGVCSSTKDITVNIQPNAISGSFSICNYSSTALSDVTTGGVWSSVSSSVASISSTGVVNALAVGTSIISYTIGNCAATKTITVNTQPDAISGTFIICNFSTTNLINDTTGGVWSSTTTGVATVSSTGVVTGAGVGVSTIYYTIGSCNSSAIVTVNSQPDAIVGGSLPICNFTTINLTDDSTGGTWSSTNSNIATISNIGVVHALVPGTTVISYTKGNCASTRIITVNTQPDAISGSLSLCNLNTTILSNDTIGGVWSSTNTAVATVNSSTGVVTGQSVGTSIITYSVGNCYSTKTVTVHIQPDAISGSLSVCNLASTNLSNDTLGGAWSSSSTTVATINSIGHVVAHSVGNTIISYTKGSCRSTAILTVNSQPSSITGVSSFCNYSSTILNDDTTGGIWTSVNTNVATVNSSGIVSGVRVGTSIISYSVGNCYATKTVSVQIQPDAISGNLSICNLSTSTLTNDTLGGTWSSSSPSVATISSIGVVTGRLVGNTIITYTKGICKSTAIVTVNIQPSSIYGSASICNYSVSVLSDDTLSGIWSSSNTTVASINSGGLVSAHSVGTTIVSYSIGNCYATKVVTVQIQPDAISGSLSVCNLATTSLTNDTLGGTWSSSASAVASINSSGVVTGHTVGFTIITYLKGTCKSLSVLTVNIQPSPIAGTASVCNYSSTTLTDDTLHGIWSSSNTLIATINSTGNVSALAVGNSTISYGVGGCYATKIVTVHIQPDAISGLNTLCNLSSITLVDDSLAGTWSSANTLIATINSSGVVTGVNAGATAITYSIGTCKVNKTITVNPQPTAISGSTSVCKLLTTTLSNGILGGNWTSTNTIIGTIGSSTGIVTGLLNGTTTISYTMPATGCFSTKQFTVNPLPSIIAGNATVCANYEGTTVLSDTITGGTWTSSNVLLATIGTTSGIVTGISAGYPIITYTLPVTGCIRTVQLTVNQIPANITGNSSVCEASEGTTTLHDATGGGTWSSNNSNIASVNLSTGVVTGINHGTTTISFTIPLTGCYNTKTIIVNSLPAPITGVPYVCSSGEGTTTLSDVSYGGIWSSNNSNIAYIGSYDGIVSGALPGITIVTYTYPATNCYVTLPITVSATPAPITGSTNMCLGETKYLNNTTPSGTWVSSNTGIATISSTGSPAAVTGVTVGSVEISYILNSCYSTIWVNVHTQPAPISGNLSVCENAIANMYDTPLGGIWSSSNTGVATIIPTGGTLLGTSVGTTNITYTYDNCISVATVTVNTQPLSIIGIRELCTGFSTTLVDATIGGTWSSVSSEIASVSGTGVVTGNTMGSTIVSYSIGSCFSTIPIFVNIQPTPIVGAPVSICNYASAYLTDATIGGKWISSDTLVTTVDSNTGHVVGVSVGTSHITYSIGNCFVTAPVTVNVQPTPIFGGPTVICNSFTTTYTDTTLGGSWSSQNVGIADVNSAGVITGHSVGSTIITYAIGACKQTAGITVNTQPSPIIGGNSSLCNYAVITISDAVAGGQWTLVNSATAKLDSLNTSTAKITGKHAGSTLISYTIGNCFTTTTITVNTQPTNIYGSPVSLCIGQTSTLHDSTSGGIWISSIPSVATVSPTGVISPIGVVTGVTEGTSIMTYIIGNCLDTESVIIHPIPNLTVKDTTICLYASGILNVTGTNVDFYSWSPTGSLSCSTCSNPIANPLVTTVYTIIGTSIYGCIDTVTLTDSVVNLTNITISGKDSICIGQIDTLTTFGASRYVWSPTVGLDCNTCAIVHAQPNASVIYTLIASNYIGCADTTSYTVTVTPFAYLSNTIAPTFICTDETFIYFDTCTIASAIVKWYRDEVIGILPAISNGVNDINETLSNTTQQNQTVNYNYILSYLDCIDTQVVSIVVEPIPVTPKITVKPPVTLCSQTLYQNFATSVPPISGEIYTWSIDNGTIFATGTNGQSCVVNFTSPGISTILLKANYIGSECYSSDSTTVEVTTNVSPSVGVVYDNHNFVCLLNTADSYQWGYDDAGTLASFILKGEVMQNYYNYSPEWNLYYYWVITTKDGCSQKSYYNTPSSISNVRNSGVNAIKVYPNPANDEIYIEIGGSINKSTIEIHDITGKVMFALPGESKMHVDISDLPAGFYFVSLYENNLKTASAKFIKGIGKK